MIPVSTLLSLKNDYSVRCQAIKDGDQYPFYSWCCENVPNYKTLRGNLAFRRKILLLAADNLDFKNDLYAMCGRDMLFFINTFCFTYDPRLDGKVVPFITYDFQDVNLDSIKHSIERPADQLSEKSRDMGASWMNIIVFEWKWQFSPYSTFRLLSRNENLVDRNEDPDCLFWKLDFILDHQPRWLQPSYNRVNLLFKNNDNNSTMTGLSTTSDAATGGRCTAMLLDEFAKVPDGHGMLSSTRDVTRCRIFNSSHKGSATAFYKLSTGKTMKCVMHWSVHPEKAIGMYHSEGGKIIRHDDFSGIVDMPEMNKTFNFPEDYPFRKDGKLRSPFYDNECDRAAHPMEIAQELDMDPFSSDFQFFDPAMVAQIEKEHVCAPFDEGEIEFDADSYDPLGFLHGVNGPLKLWIYPDYRNTIDRNLEIGCGADISAGTGASNSALTFVNLRTGEKLAEYANPWIRPAEFARLTVAYCNYFNNAFLLFDASGPTGRQFSDELMRIGYRNLYYRRNEEGLNKKVSDKPGVFLNTKERSAILGLYRRSLKDKTFIQRSSLANQECLEYIQKTSEEIIHSSAVNNIDPSGAGMSHGDRCIADCCAAKCIDFLGTNTKAPDKADLSPRSYAYKSRERERKAKRKSLW